MAASGSTPRGPRPSEGRLTKNNRRFFFSLSLAFSAREGEEEEEEAGALDRRGSTSEPRDLKCTMRPRSTRFAPRLLILSQDSARDFTHEFRACGDDFLSARLERERAGVREFRRLGLPNCLLPIFLPTSDRTRLPAEFKHITKRRKRN